MKKYIVNENWETVELNDKTQLFIVAVEQNLPDCSFIAVYDTDDVKAKAEYAELVNQYRDILPIDKLQVSLVSIPNTVQARQQCNFAKPESATTPEAIAAVNELLSGADSELIEAWTTTLDEARRRNRRKKRNKVNITYSTGYPAMDIAWFNKRMGTDFELNNDASDIIPETPSADGGVGEGMLGGESSAGDCSGMGESLKLKEGRYKKERKIKRYYIRPQNIFCSKKNDILRALVKDIGIENNCSVYSLKSLDDHDDVHLLQPSDIIYYWDEGILYDKNHVPVLDYDLNVKHEEDRKKFGNVDAIADKTFQDEYKDRYTELTADIKEDLETFDETKCIICGEPIEGYGNNPAPVANEGRCCDVCNFRYVIPQRAEIIKANKEGK